MNRIATRADIDDFYAQKRLAVVGVSRDPKEYSRAVFKELRDRGYDVVPVNPNAAEIEGARCFASIADVTPAVEGAIVLLPEQQAEQALREATAAGIKRVWLRYHIPGAEEASRKPGMKVVSGYCPFMFIPGASFFHQFHAWGLMLAGQYPKA